MRALVLSSHWPLIHDAITMQYIGAMLLQGVLPYRDIFDMNFPLTYWIHALGIMLLGKSDVATRAYDFMWCGLAGAAIAACIWRNNKAIALSAGLMVALLHFANGYMNQLQRDFFMVPLLVGGLYFVLHNPRPLIAGLCIGAACSIKPTAAIFALFMLLVTPPRQMIAYIIGLSIVPVFAFAWMLGLGIFPAFWDIWWHFTVSIFASGAFENTFPFNRNIPVLTTLAVIFHLFTWRKNIYCRESILLLSGVAYGLAHYYIQQKGYAQHLYPFWGFLCVMVGYNIARVAEKHPRATPSAALLLLLWMPGEVLWKGDGFFNFTPLVTSSQRLEQELSEKGMPADNAHVQVMEDIFGTAWRIAYLHNWKPSSRFMYPFIFYAGGTSEVMQRYRAEFVQALKNAPPQMILLSSNTWPQYKRRVFPSFQSDAELQFLLRDTFTPVMDNRRTQIWRIK